MKTLPKSLSKLWILFFGTASAIADFFSSEIESHQLTRTLHFGFDAFGRSCLLLTLEVAFRSFSIILPLGVLCVCTALVFSTLGFIKNSFLKFIWETFNDTLSSLPGLLIALSLSVFFGNQWFTFILASFFLVIPYLIRFFESQIRLLNTQEYILRASALGGTRSHIFLKHYFPELLRSVVSIFPFLFTRLLLIETSLAFLGLTISSQGETWGHLLYQGRDYLLEAPWICFFCGAPLFLTLLSLHLLSNQE